MQSIGIFYLINGRIVYEAADVFTIKPSGGVRAYPRQHYEFWSDLQESDADLYGLDCYSLPRGRIRYNDKTSRFEILADRHILDSESLRAQVLVNFNLDVASVHFRPDEMYRCDICNNTEKRRY